MVSQDASWEAQFDEVWLRIYKELIKLKEIRNAELEAASQYRLLGGSTHHGGAAATAVLDGGGGGCGSPGAEPSRRGEGRDGEAAKTAVVAVRTGLPRPVEAGEDRDVVVKEVDTSSMKVDGSQHLLPGDGKDKDVREEDKGFEEAEVVDAGVFVGEAEKKGKSEMVGGPDGEPGDGSKRERKLEDIITQEVGEKRKRDAEADDVAHRAGLKNGKRKVVSFRTAGDGVDASASDSEAEEKVDKVGSGALVNGFMQRRAKKTRCPVGSDANLANGSRAVQNAESDVQQVAQGDVPPVGDEVEIDDGNLVNPATDAEMQVSCKDERDSVLDISHGARKDVHSTPGRPSEAAVRKSAVPEKGLAQPNLHVLTSVAAAIEANVAAAAVEVEDVVSVEAGDERVSSILSPEDGELAEQALLIKSLSTQKDSRLEVLKTEVTTEVRDDFVKTLADFVPKAVLGEIAEDGGTQVQGAGVRLALRVGQYIMKLQESVERERKLKVVLEADLTQVHSEKERIQQEKDRLFAHLSSIATTVEEGSMACSYCQSIMGKLSEESLQEAFRNGGVHEGRQVVAFAPRVGRGHAHSPSSSSCDEPASTKVVTISDDEKEEASELQLSNGKDVSASSSGDVLPFKRKRRVEEVMEEKPKRYGRRGSKEKERVEMKPPVAIKHAKVINDKSEIRRSRRLSIKEYDHDLVDVDIKQIGEDATDEEAEVLEAKAEEVEEDKENSRKNVAKESSRRVKPPKGRAEAVSENPRKSAPKGRRHEASKDDEKGEEKELIRRLKARNAKMEGLSMGDKKAQVIERPPSGITAADLDDHIPKDEPELEFKCGCTSSKYGDTVGHVKVYKSGDFVLFCECKPGCTEAGIPLTPAAFERHAGRGSSKKWKNTIWVMIGDDKVPIAKVKALEPYYKRYKVRKNLKVTPSPGTAPPGVQVVHRDEFVKCCKCHKERRFKRRNKEESRLYHDAMLNRRWECANLPDERYARCGEDEEREVRRVLKGCPRARNCPGCPECVCIGCLICKFSDCTCRSCSEFMANAPPTA